MYTSHLQQKQKGFVLLYAVLVASIALASGISILEITKLQLTLTGVARESEKVFHIADAGLECVLFHNGESKFDINVNPVPISCMDSSATVSGGKPQSGDEQTLQFDWQSGGSDVCSDISVWKFTSASTSGGVSMSSVSSNIPPCAPGVTCTIIKSRGWNKSCAGPITERTIERELTQVLRKTVGP